MVKEHATGNTGRSRTILNTEFPIFAFVQQQIDGWYIGTRCNGIVDDIERCASREEAEKKFLELTQR
jgi:hypothetical protein